jgi:DNA-nicking Smr family endonuclease
MARKPDPEDDALWERVTVTVRPLKGRRMIQHAASKPVRPELVEERAPYAAPAARPSTSLRTKGARGANGPGVATGGSGKGLAVDTLDGGWDRRLRRGIVAPDLTIDLHGHTLSTAHAQLEASLARAVAMHFRLLLIVTGRAPRPDTERRDGRPVRGAIRASIGDWLDHSRLAAHVAAVRNAHPRHGGAGAIYVVLRRTRD